jgi:hypothetical protein
MQTIYQKFRAEKVGKEFKFQKYPDCLGSGSYGSVFAVDDTKVVKVTCDKREIWPARKIQKTKFKHVWEIYNISTLNINGIAYFAIVGERLSLPNSIGRGLLSQATSISNRAFEMRVTIEKTAQYRLCDLNKRKKHIVLETATQHLAGIKEAKKKISKNSWDFHSGNCLFDKSGNLKLFDILVAD